MYGKDVGIEDWFMQLEGQLSKIIEKIIETEEIPKVEYDIPNLMSIQVISDIVCTSMQDLVLFIIKNNPSLKFITSDCPVTRYNLLFNKRKHMCGYGYAQMGFQAFFPISDKLCLCLMDPIPYNVKCNKKCIIYLNNENLVYELNKLFLKNSDEMIFFSNEYRKEQIQNLVKNKLEVNK